MFARFLIGVLLATVLIATSWALVPEGFFRAHDYIHGARIAEMVRMLEEGQIPPRWSQYFGFGYGMPLFEFYAPLPYFVGAVFHWMGFSLIHSVKLIFLLASAVLIWGSYALGSKLFGRASGVVVAAASALAPYRAVNLFVRGALSEAWGIMAMPWILLGIVQVIRREKWGWVTLTLSLSTLFLSHNITSLLFVPWAAIFALVYWWVTQKPKLHRPSVSALVHSPLLVTAGSFLLAVGLSAFYIFPALMEKDYTKVDGIFSGYFHYYQHFVYLRQFLTVSWGFTGSEWGLSDGISFFLGYGQVALVLVALVAGAIQLWHQVRTKTALSRSWWLMLCCAVLTGGALLMSTFKSAFIWEAIPVLSYAQFPWRWLGVALIFLSLMGGAGIALIKPKILRWWLAILAVIVLLPNYWYFRPEYFLTDSEEYYYSDPDKIVHKMSSILPDYIPKQMPDLKDLKPAERFLNCGASECSGAASIITQQSHQVLIQTNFSQQQKLDISIAWFPGWQAELDGNPVELHQAANGVLSVTVPPGEHLVGLRLGSTPVRRLSDGLSALSLVLLVALSIHVSQPTRMKVKKTYDS